MPTNKAYTNVTFTRRVDHDGGRRRPPKAPAGLLICSECRSVYVSRRWRAPDDPKARVVAATEHPRPTICTGCARKHSQVPSGYVRVKGAFYVAHRAEIEHLLEHEAHHALEDNPTARIMSWDRSRPNVLVLTTTTEHLAERLGFALHKAYHGVVDYGFSHENKLARVTWSRD